MFWGEKVTIFSYIGLDAVNRYIKTREKYI